MHTIGADYLVVGAGAMGMAFIDTLVTETSATSATRARVVLVDRNRQPGGHWTTAYPFVRPHQPHPNTDLDWLRIAPADYGNQLRRLDDPDLTAWLCAARLDLFDHLMGHLLAPASAKPRVRDRILRMAKSALSATATKLDQLMVDEALV
jgi:hypothetical protein